MDPARPTRSILELLHPAGRAETVRVFGRSCRQGFGLCPNPVGGADELADLVVFAPSREELATDGWLESTLRQAVGCIRQDGVLYLLAFGGARRKASRLLAERGLRVSAVHLHHPSWQDAQALIPLERGTLTYAFSRLIRTDPVRRRVALGLLRVPGMLPLIRGLLPSVGLVAQFPGAAQHLAWFSRLLPDRIEPAGVVVNSSWRGPDGAVLLHAVAGARGDAVAIAKTWLATNGERAMVREAAGLEDIAARAAEFGVRVPRLLERGWLGQQPYLVESAVFGEKAAVLLQNDPGQLEALLTRLTGWLRAWSSVTAEPRLLTRELLDDLLVRPASELAPGLGADADYRISLDRLAGRLAGQTMPFVPVHGDLTMVNVLVDRDMHLGVIDWETARPWLPLADFLYASVDAVAAMGDYRDRPAAYEACFSPGGRYRSLVGSLEGSLARELMLTQDQVTLCSQAAWISFAVAERRETAKHAPDEFLRIASRAARRLCDSDREIAGMQRL